MLTADSALTVAQFYLKKIKTQFFAEPVEQNSVAMMLFAEIAVVP